MASRKPFLEFGIKEVAPWEPGDNGFVFARFALRGDRDEFLKLERVRPVRADLKYQYVPVRFLRPGESK